MDLHWLRVPQRIQYKLCVLVHGCLNGTAPGYLSDLTVSVASAARRQLRSASTSDLVVPSTRRASIGDRAFAAETDISLTNQLADSQLADKTSR